MQNNVSLKDYIDIRFEEKGRALAAAQNAMQERLASMNEFRDQLKDQAARFVTRDEMNSKFDNVINSIVGLQKIVYLGLGVILTLQFLLKFFIR